MEGFICGFVEQAWSDLTQGSQGSEPAGSTVHR